MNQLIKKLDDSISIENNYKNINSDRFNIEQEIGKLDENIESLKKKKKNFQGFMDLYDIIEQIDKDLLFNKGEFLKDEENILTNFDSCIDEKNYEELNNLLIVIDSNINIYVKTLNEILKQCIDNIETQYNELKKLSTISDLKIEYNKIGNEFFKIENSSIIEFIKQKITKLKNSLNQSKKREIIKKELDTIININQFFEKTKEISDLSKIAEHYNLSEETTEFLLELITNGSSLLNQLTTNILDELEEHFSQFTKNLIISISGK